VADNEELDDELAEMEKEILKEELPEAKKGKIIKNLLFYVLNLYFKN